MLDSGTDPVRIKAAEQLIELFVTQGHPRQYAQYMAVMTITRADVDLLSAQLSRLLAWIEQEHPAVHQGALDLVAQTREEFERRIHNG